MTCLCNPEEGCKEQCKCSHSELLCTQLCCCKGNCEQEWFVRAAVKLCPVTCCMNIIILLTKWWICTKCFLGTRTPRGNTCCDCKRYWHLESNICCSMGYQHLKTFYWDMTFLWCDVIFSRVVWYFGAMHCLVNKNFSHTLKNYLQDRGANLTNFLSLLLLSMFRWS